MLVKKCSMSLNELRHCKHVQKSRKGRSLSRKTKTWMRVTTLQVVCESHGSNMAQGYLFSDRDMFNKHFHFFFC